MCRGGLRREKEERKVMASCFLLRKRVKLKKTANSLESKRNT
jgi:hypothetical protein